MGDKIFLGLIFLCSIIGCQQKKETIDAETVLLYLGSIEKKDSCVSQINDVEFSLIQDTLIERNLALSFLEANDSLRRISEKIEEQAFNTVTKTYLKALVIADFVYASSSYQFLGSFLGQSESLYRNDEWKALTAEKLYELANTNQMVLDCDQRSHLFKELINAHLNVTVRDTSIVGRHTYPILKIGREEYIVDPSEPIIFTNDSLNKILSVQDLKQQNTIRFHPSKRTFGNTKLLMSKRLDSILGSIQSTNFKLNLIQYFDDQKHYLQENPMVCVASCLDKRMYGRPVASAKNTIAITYNGSNMKTTTNTKSFKIKYFGNECEN